jgi:hypothetical protein
MKKYLLKKVLFLTLIGFLGACSEVSDVDFDELESKIEDTLPEDNEVGQQSFCKGFIATQSSSLNVRTSPEITDNICTTLDKGTPIIISMNGHENGFFRIQTTRCGDENKWVYVSDKFVEVEDNCIEEINVETPPVVMPTPPVEEEIPRAPDSEVSEIRDLKSYIRSNLTKTSTTRPLTRNSSSGSVEVFKLPGSGTTSICGSKHIRSYRTNPHMAQDTLCAWTAVAQEWAKTECPKGNADCRIMLGDASFGAKQPSSWPHSTHRRGWCMDIWPMRKKNCGEKEVTWKSSCYDGDATQKFVKLLIKHGADKGNQFFFNDPKISETRRLSNHDDHIHVCFKPSNSIVKTRCEQTKVDRKICSEFK